MVIVLNLNLSTVLHLMAELTNPFLILRTALKISGKKDTRIYEINEYFFAGGFLLIRMILTPVVTIMLYEGD